MSWGAARSGCSWHASELMRTGDGAMGPLRPLADRRSSYAMHPWLNDSERTLQFLLTIQPQDPLKFSMHGIHGQWQHAEIDDPRPAALDEDQSAEIAVAGDEEPVLLLR